MAIKKEPLTESGIHSGYLELPGTVITEKPGERLARVRGQVEKLRIQQESEEEKHGRS